MKRKLPNGTLCLCIYDKEFISRIFRELQKFPKGRKPNRKIDERLEWTLYKRGNLTNKCEKVICFFGFQKTSNTL